MMNRLSALDAAFLDAEDEDRHASLAIASVAVLEGPVPSHAEFVDAVAAKLPLLPRYRQKLRTVLWDLGPPVWVDDPDVDLDYHVRRTALPAPGDDDALCRLVARLMSQRLDRDRPLWECWVVEGLAGGRWAMLSKVHHCMVDGVGGTNIYNRLFDPAREPSAPAAPISDDRAVAAEPSSLRLTVEALGELLISPGQQVRLLGRAAAHPRRLLRRVVDTTKGMAMLVRAVAAPATASSLSGPIGQYRRYAVARADLSDVVRVARHFDASVNDVLLAAVSGGFRTLLLGRGEHPDRHTIRSLVPVSVRAPGEDSVHDNRISLMLPFLPVDIADPVRRLAAVHAHMATLKGSKEAEAGAAMTSLAAHEPFLPISWGIRLASRLPQRSIITVTTNVPGPRQPLYLLGRRIVEILPYVPIAIRLRTGVAVLTYCDRVGIGVTTDYRSAPEAGALAAAIEAGIAELVAAPPAAPRQRRRGQRAAPAVLASTRKPTAPENVSSAG